MKVLSMIYFCIILEFYVVALAAKMLRRCSLVAGLSQVNIAPLTRDRVSG